MVKQGYKQAEIGVIPEEWEAKQLSLLLTIGHGKDQKEIETKTGKYPILATSGVIGYTNNYLWDKPSALIGRKGTINKPQYIEAPFWTIDTLFYTKIFDTVWPKYVYYLFCTIDWLSLNEASGVPSLSANNIEKVMVAVPPLPEQKRIAEALSDVDSMISSLEKLIEKKKAVKQGAMQELLTGKKRLPGFDGEWKEKQIGEYGDFVSGNGFPLKYQGNRSGLYPFYKVSDFNNVGNSREMIKANNYISDDVANILSCNIIPKQSIVFAKIGAAIALERKRITSCVCCIDNNMMSFQPYEKETAQFMCYLFQTIRFGELVEATALPSLSGKTIGEIKKIFPPTSEEQIAISSILSDMDNEIEALEQKLKKTRQIKQGMMQQLLTGKIRLV